MQITTGGNMLNFGYWNEKTLNPLQAQYALSTMTGKFASLQTARTLLDVGSGYSAPALQWSLQYNFLDILCININLQQLSIAIRGSEIGPDNERINQSISNSASTFIKYSERQNIFHLNATSTMLPVKSNSVDRVIAFESAQHFKPLTQFIQESNRVLKCPGLLVIAMPVITNSFKLISLPLFTKLGILSITWASEHYNLEYVKSMVKTNGFQIKEIRCIGPNVYGPLARYYIENRDKLKEKVSQEYSKFLETILYKSLLKMDDVSHQGIIDYILLKAEKKIED
jgi:cyclopropane fatty-acyl-phospholipid synthase-like methyltransferase